MDYTVFWGAATIENQHRALFLQYGNILFMESFGLFLSIFLNYCLIFDLFIMIRYPFSDKAKYMTLYQWGSVVAATVVSVAFVIQYRLENSYSADWIV
jgi:hypothetical protein